MEQNLRFWFGYDSHFLNMVRVQMKQHRVHIALAIAEVLLLAIVFVYYSSLHVETSFLGGHPFILNYTPGEYLDLRFGNFDIVYLANCSISELKVFFPNLYMLIYLGFWTLKYLVPVSLVLMILWKLPNWAERHFSSWFKTYRPLTGFAISLTIALAFYFLLRGRSIDPVHYQLLLARVFLGLNTIFLFAYSWRNRLLMGERLKAFLFEPALPYSLAITRILFFSYLTLIYLAVIFQYGPNIGKLATRPLPGIGWLIDLLPVSPDIYMAMGLSGIVFSLLAAVGYRTRMFMLLNAFTIFYVMATPNFYGKIWHQQLPIWISWILAASPCADVLSIDSRLKNSQPVKGPYAFHLRMIWIQFGLIYFWAGFYKLWDSGFDWALNDTVVNLVTIEWFEHYDRIPSIRIDRLPMLIKTGALLTVIFELFYLFLLFGKKTRWISIMGGPLMHNLIGKFMYISFFFFLQVFYIVFIPWNWIIEKVRPRIAPSEMGTEAALKWSSPAVLIPLVIVSSNALCGLFKINSYPFSIYPVYTDVVPDTVAYFDYHILDAGMETVDFREEARHTRFRWEDYSRIEYELIRHYRQTDTIDTAGVVTMWRRWQMGVPALKDADTVDVFIAKRLLDPDKASRPISEEFLLRLNLQPQDAH